MRAFTKIFICFLLAAMLAGVAPARAEDANQAANRTFIEAIGMIRRASATYDTREAVRLYRSADRLLKKVIADYPESTLAVQISTNQFVGDFDPLEFRARIRSLSCERGSYVEDFLSEYGIASTTGPLTEACFLYRLEALLAPVEQPISAARWDWLSLAASYHLHGQADRARDIILPFLAALSKKISPNEAQDSLLFLSRALALTGEGEQAQKISQRISDCAARLNNMADMMRIALWAGRNNDARLQADELQQFARDNQCNWQMGLAAQALYLTGREEEAKKIYTDLFAEQFTNVKEEDRRENTPPELAIAAATLGEPEQALAILQVVMEANPWLVDPVMTALGARGLFDAAQNFSDGLKEPDMKAEAYAVLIDAAMRKDDKKRAGGMMAKLAALKVGSGQPEAHSAILAMRARAEKAIYKDDRWRSTLQAAINIADTVEESAKRNVALPLIATLAYIRTGTPVLD